ncbi:MAG: amidohydrolase family protein [Archangium sp.]|nr:amidohydrolase family protein [Archangium sp.]
MATLLRGGTVVDLEPTLVERADLRIDGDRIVERATGLEPQEGDEVIDLKGRILFPGLVSAWHRRAGLFLPGAPRAGKGFAAEQQARHKLEDAMDGDALEASASATALDALLCGTTTLFDSSASGTDIGGSLSRVAQGFNKVGLRGVLSRVITERGGALQREENLEENVSFIGKSRGRVRGAFAVEGLAALSDEGLSGLKEARAKTNAFLLASLAEDPQEERQSRDRHGAPVSERLLSHGLTGTRVVLAHGVHFSWPELSSLIADGTWLAHAARSNMATGSGHATPAKFGVHACFGTDLATPDLLAEAQAASLRATDSGQAIDLLRFLANGHRLATEAFGTSVGPLTVGSVADLVVLDYAPASPFETATLPAHLLFGISSRFVESVMVDGLWRVWKRKALSVDTLEIAKAARETAQSLWQKMQ